MIHQACGQNTGDGLLKTIVSTHPLWVSKEVDIAQTLTGNGHRAKELRCCTSELWKEPRKTLHVQRVHLVAEDFKFEHV